VQKSIAVLITCHNRASQTREALTHLYHQHGLNSTFTLDIYLVDDQSTDGTAELVKTSYPEVHIIKGSGNLYWNRGMHLAWQTAAEKGNYDLYLWLNDDTFLTENAIVSMIDSKKRNSIIVGATTDSSSRQITYGGFSKKHLLVEPNNSYQECNYFNGNCVLVSNEVYEIMGNLDPIFHHALGDFDYGLRARKKDIQILLAPKPVGTCEMHTHMPGWINPEINIIKRMKKLYNPKSGCSPSEFFIFEKRHYGVLIAIYHFITTHFRATFPYINKLKPL
jgi:glycosyltransferase involved in cell wall biosynthesis